MPPEEQAKLMAFPDLALETTSLLVYSPTEVIIGLSDFQSMRCRTNLLIGMSRDFGDHVLNAHLGKYINKQPW